MNVAVAAIPVEMSSRIRTASTVEQLKDGMIVVIRLRGGSAMKKVVVTKQRWTVADIEKRWMIVYVDVAQHERVGTRSTNGVAKTDTYFLAVNE
jgi:hypothetical protein